MTGARQERKEQSYMIWLTIFNPRTFHLKTFPRARNTQEDPRKGFSTRVKHARKSEGGPKLALVKNFKDP